MRKTSKRQRKQRDKVSLKAKGNAARKSVLDVKLRDGNGEAAPFELPGLDVHGAPAGADPDDSNVAVMPGSRKKREPSSGDGSGRATPAGTEEAPPPPSSRSQARKLRRIAEIKAAREKMTGVIETLNRSSLGTVGIRALRSVAVRGQKETRRQAEERARALEAAGLELPQDLAERLGRGREAPGSPDDGSGDISDDGPDQGSEEGSSSGSDSDVGFGATKPVGPRLGAASPASAGRGGAGVDGDETEDSEGREDDREADTTPPAPAPTPKKRPLFAGLRKAIADRMSGGGASAAGAGTDDGPGTEGGAEGGAGGEGGPAGEARGAGSAEDAEASRSAQLAAAASTREELARDGVRPLSDASAQEDVRTNVPPPTVALESYATARVVDFPGRPSEAAEARGELPIAGHEQEILEALTWHDVAVLSGETGCGKTTQVPQMLLEHGYGCGRFPERAGAVAVTQPRRVGAVSTARRVAAELGAELGGPEVGYAVRHDVRVSDSTALRFCTDGVLLREIREDFLLRRYSAVIVDEAHERSLNTDVLLGLLSRTVRLRREIYDAHVRERGPLGDGPEAGAEAGGQGMAGARAPASPPPPRPLKLLIMSATLNAEDFLGNRRLFPDRPPFVVVPARQYPVVARFAKRTELDDYAGAAFRKLKQIHESMPSGGVLVFLTGQREIEDFCRRVRETYAVRQTKGKGKGGGGGASGEASGPRGGTEAGGGLASAAKEDAGAEPAPGGPLDPYAEGGYLEGADAAEAPDEAALEGEDKTPSDLDDFEAGLYLEDEEEVEVLGGAGFTPEQIAQAEKAFEEREGLPMGGSGGKGGGGRAAGDGGGRARDGEADDPRRRPVHVLPLYASLSPEAQAAVFHDPPAGHRLVVVATNVAETSLTIPGIRYVVDCGRAKQRIEEESGGHGVARYEVRWVSKAAAAQRAGRAGRVGPGQCYRLYSSAVFGREFVEHAEPEVLRSPLEGAVLALATMGISRPAAFPWPTPPPEAAVARARDVLAALGALDAAGAPTPLGRRLAALPLPPRAARVLDAVIEEAGGGGAGDAEVAGPTDRAGAPRGQAPGAPTLSRAYALEALPFAVSLAAVGAVEAPFGAGPASAPKHLRDPSGDALTCLRALCAWEAPKGEAGEGGRGAAPRGGFGRDDGAAVAAGLVPRRLREAAALRRQLARGLRAHAREMAEGAAEATGAASALSAAAALAAAAAAPAGALGERARVALLRALAAGWADRLARRVSRQEAAESAPADARAGASMSRRLARYEAAFLPGRVALHPQSSLYRAPPEWIVYEEAIRPSERRPEGAEAPPRGRAREDSDAEDGEGGQLRDADTGAAVGRGAAEAGAAASADVAAPSPKRVLLRGVTAIDPSCLPSVAPALCIEGPPLEVPHPFYDARRDRVSCWREVTYGPREWALPRVASTDPRDAERAAAFASALLAGKVLPELATHTRGLLVSPEALAQTAMARAQPRAARLLGALTRARVDSRRSLAEAWAASPNVLLPELAGCYREDARPGVIDARARLRHEATGVGPLEHVRVMPGPGVGEGEGGVAVRRAGKRPDRAAPGANKRAKQGKWVT